MSANDWYGFLGMGVGTVIIILVAILLIVLVIQMFKTHQLKTKTALEIAQDAAFRKLSESTLKTQQETEKKLTLMKEELDEMRKQIASMHKMMKEID